MTPWLSRTSSGFSTFRALLIREVTPHKCQLHPLRTYTKKATPVERDLFTLASVEDAPIEVIPFQKKVYDTKRKQREAKKAERDAKGEGQARSVFSKGQAWEPSDRRKGRTTASWAVPRTDMPQATAPIDAAEGLHPSRREADRSLEISLTLFREQGPRHRSTPEWIKRDATIKRKFDGGPWKPTAKVLRITMDGIRTFRKQFPQLDVSKIGALFKISPEAVRRILKSRWKPTAEDEANLSARWDKRREVLETKAIQRTVKAREAEVSETGFREVDIKDLRVKRERGDGSWKRERGRE